jgi:asparagine synthase (glutamine-hydrolysing)
VHPEVERNLDFAALDFYLSMNYVPAPYTLVHGIEKLCPGCWLEWADGKTRSEPFWRIPCEVDARWTFESAKIALDALLRQSIQEHLVSDVPLGLWLSGGLDSSTLLHYASAASSSKLKTFSISFAGRSFDETAHIRRVAARYDEHGALH